MTAHGAYTKALSAARRVRGYANDASRNIQALNAAYPLPDDPDLLRELHEIGEGYKALSETLAQLKARSVSLARSYLERNRHRLTKDYCLSEGSPSTRLRQAKM